MSDIPFVWDKNYGNTEQMRPHLADFLAVKKEITDAGKYPYNDSFKGRIQGLAESADEDVGIYLLQRLADLDTLQGRIAKFLRDGGYRLAEQLPKTDGRGTLVRTGWYTGGTGWGEYQHVKVTVDEHGHVLFKLPRQRNWRTHHDGPSAYLFRPDAT